MYATLEQARAAGAAGDDATVTDALSTARDLIDRFTREWWEPTPATVSTVVRRDGFAPLPYVVQAVTSVVATSTGNVLAPEAYRVLSSTVEGEPDGIQLAVYGSDPIVLGAEPWAGGYAGLLDRVGRAVRVTGTFGAAVTPPVVAESAARLAAWVTATGGFGPTRAPDVDLEGNALTVSVDADAPRPVGRTTGLPDVDLALTAAGLVDAESPVKVS